MATQSSLAGLESRQTDPLVNLEQRLQGLEDFTAVANILAPYKKEKHPLFESMMNMAIQELRKHFRKFNDQDIRDRILQFISYKNLN